MLASALMPALAGVPFAQDSPQLLADRFLAEADEHLGQGKNQAAREAMSEALALHRDHGIEGATQVLSQVRADPEPVRRVRGSHGVAAALPGHRRHRPIPQAGVGAHGEDGATRLWLEARTGSDPGLIRILVASGGRPQGPG